MAPVGLKPLIMRGLDREIQRALAGEPARVFFKLNSLTDREVIDKISEASCAGVRVDMIIRGISCLKPNIAGKTETCTYVLSSDVSWSTRAFTPLAWTRT